MSWNLKQMLPAMATSLVAFTSIANANYDDAQMRNLENRVSALEQRKGANGMINPPARPTVKDGDDVFVTGDIFLWQSHENGLAYAFDSEDSESVILDGKAETPDFDWDFGFRLGLGYNIPHDGWDVYAYWTHFHNNAHDEELAPLGGALFPALMNPAANLTIPLPVGSLCSEAEEHWHLHMNIADLQVGREFFVSKWLTLRPSIGLRSAWIRQKFDVEYEFINTVNSLLGTEVEIEMKNKYWGLGLRTGLDTQWGLGSGWSLYGDMGVSLLYGFFHIDQSEHNGGIERLDVDSSFHLGRAMTDLALGLRWEENFSNDEYRILLQFGWEHMMFFGQNQLMTFVDGSLPGNFVSNQGDLTIQGWTLAGRFDF